MARQSHTPGRKIFRPHIRGAAAHGGRAITIVGDCASIAYVGAKYFSPVHPWCGGVLRPRDHNVLLIAHQSRTYGRKIFRPYQCGAWLHWAGATIWGMSMFDGWVMVDGWRTHGRKIFRPYTCGALLNSACATIWGMSMFDGWVNGYCWRT